MGPDAEYRAHLAAGRFMLQHGVESGVALFYPRIAMPVTGEALEWREASGRGLVYSVSVVRKRPPEQSYSVALIDLAEGPRMMSRVEGIAPEAVRIGMPVQARIVAGDDAPFVVFDPAP